MSYVYILRSLKHPKTYVGSTTDLTRRLKEHNRGLGTFSKRYRPWIITYVEEFCGLSEARQRERYFKTAAGRRFIKKQKLIQDIPG